MISSITRPIGKLVRRSYLALATIAVLILVSPGVPAGAQNQPEATCPAGGQCFADVPVSNTFYEFVNRIYQQDLVTGYACGGPNEPCDSESRPYYRPGAIVTRQQMAKFIDNARRLAEINITVENGPAPIRGRNNTGTAIAAYSTSGQALIAQSQSSTALYAQTSGNAAAVYGFATSSGGTGVVGQGDTGVNGTGSPGVLGESTTGVGVEGFSSAALGSGVHGYCSDCTGVFGNSGNDYGVAGESNDAPGAGVYGVGYSGARAGFFQGDVNITGTCTGCFGPSKVDHPLDPANKYLYHSPVQSDDMMNVYNGNVTLDTRGEAIVQMPEWFEALNREFRYQLTAIGAPGPNLHVAEEIKNNRFKIAGGSEGMKVSWLVTGVRQDPFAEQNRVQVEEDKSNEEKGKYLHPTVWGQPESQGIGYEKQQELRNIGTDR